MRTRFFFLLLLLTLAFTSLAQRPGTTFGPTLTLSDGRYGEVFANDTLRHIGKFVYNTVTQKAYRFGFQGQEEQDGGMHGAIRTSSAFEFRMHDPHIGRFLSIDPLAAKYPWNSPYAFAVNSPIQFIDSLGMGPGDRFETIDAAALDFANSYNDNSIAENKEYAASIIQLQDSKGIYYTYVQPKQGDEGGAKPSSRGFSGQITVAYIHAHGGYDPNYKSEIFSPKDKDFADEKGVPLYLSTPAGALKMYNPENKAESILSTQIPSDRSTPEDMRLNNIDSSLLPKDEPTYGAWEYVKHNVLNPLGDVL